MVSDRNPEAIVYRYAARNVFSLGASATRRNMRDVIITMPLNLRMRRVPASAERIIEGEAGTVRLIDNMPLIAPLGVSQKSAMRQPPPPFKAALEMRDVEARWRFQRRLTARCR